MIVGRTQELERLSSLLDAAPTGPAILVLEGEQGIGKSTLWTACLELAREREMRVLASRPAGSDAGLSFLALGDLVGTELDGSSVALPEPQQRALDVALLRTEAAGREPNPLAISTATLGLIRGLAADNTTIVAIDDADRVDAGSARVLAFVLRRLEAEALGFLIVRSGEGGSLPLGLSDAVHPERVDRLRLGPMSPEDLATLVRRVGMSLPPPEARRLHDLSGGNPFFALEIARAATTGEERATGHTLPIPRSLREDLIRSRLAGLPEPTMDLLLGAACATRPTLDLLAAVCGSETVRSPLQRAIDAGLLRVDAPEIRFVHPMYRSVIYADSSRERRHAFHARLADLAVDQEERARHLALAAEGPDGDVAAALDEAAANARERGAPDGAAELLAHALRLTPPSDPEARLRRLSLAADARFLAGDMEGARRLASEAVNAARPGPERAQALRSLAGIESERGAIADARNALEGALGEGGTDTRSRSEVNSDLARIALRRGELAAAEIHARTALELAEGAADPALTARAVTVAVEVNVMLGRGLDHELIRRLEKLETETEAMPVAASPELVTSAALVFADEHDRAGAILERLQTRAEERGDEPGRRAVLTLLAQLHLRSGDWIAARRAGEASRRLAEQLDLVPATELGLLAYLDAAEGRADEARSLAELGLERSGDDRAGLLWNLGALGFLELSLGRAEQALGYLGRAGGLLDSMGVAEPGAFPFVADEAETLLDLGEIPQARRRIEWLEGRAEDLGRPGLAAAALRCRGSSLAATGDLTGALDALERAVTLVERASLPLEQGRTLLALGATRRRDRRQRPAREALEEALAIFERLGAVLWAGKARDELGRIGGRKAAVGELTEAQRRVAQLAAGGLTNREIAQALFMSVRTVEGHLSHVYAKLGFRSRTELAAYFEPRD